MWGFMRELASNLKEKVTRSVLKPEILRTLQKLMVKLGPKSVLKPELLLICQKKLVKLEILRTIWA